MTTIGTGEPLAVAVVAAIRTGDVPALTRLLAKNPGLATARLGNDDPGGMSRSLLHVATDWPGHFPNGPATVAALVQAGADVNARFRGPHDETPLHWAASSDDVAVIDALLDAGADIEASLPPRRPSARLASAPWSGVTPPRGSATIEADYSAPPPACRPPSSPPRSSWRR